MIWGKKKHCCMVNKRYFFAAKLAKSANYANFFRKQKKIMLLMTTYTKIMLAQSTKASPVTGVALQYIPVTCIVTVHVLHVTVICQF